MSIQAIQKLKDQIAILQKIVSSQEAAIQTLAQRVQAIEQQTPKRRETITLQKP